MNFLAHLFLSGDDRELQFGNFIADAVKGNDMNDFPDLIRKGILLHREIDTFTDTHPVFRQSRKRLSSKYDKISGIIVDIYYDHYLARNWSEYSSRDIKKYVASAYLNLVLKFDLLPPRSKRILPFMITQNWLVGYADFDVLRKVFRGMSRRSGYLARMEYAVDDLVEDYQLFESDFREFFPEIVRHSDDFKKQLMLY
jgi:acyl carrier protein phosphodiesterase